MSLSDAVLLGLYSGWSEDTWCAGFMHPYPDVVAEFRAWVAALPDPTEDYEREMLAEYHRQDDPTASAAPAPSGEEPGE